MISVVIPNYNGARTIGVCLDSVLASQGVEFEVLVADDGSADDSVNVISRFPCRLLRLAHGGASRARNAGAAAARGRWLFFTDADCVLEPDTLRRVRARLEESGPKTVVGGTYAVEPYDPNFFSRFQAVFINEAETRKSESPDYIATHAFAVAAEEFRASGGFKEGFLPILEDVELCHRLRRAGFRLLMDAGIQVRHIFGFTCARSLKNAARKSRFWIRYSFANRDLFADSGTASVGLKVNGAAFFCTLLLIGAASIGGGPIPLALLPAVFGGNIFFNRKLLRAFRTSHGALFLLPAALYYFLVYPVAIGAGTMVGLVELVATRQTGGGAS